MKLGSLSLKIIINELEFLRKTVTIQWKIRKKKLYNGFIYINRKNNNNASNASPSNAKEYYQSFIRKKSFTTKPVKQSKIITQEPKTFESTIIVNIKSVITEHPKNSYKLSKTIRQYEGRF